MGTVRSISLSPAGRMRAVSAPRSSSTHASRSFNNRTAGSASAGMSSSRHAASFAERWARSAARPTSSGVSRPSASGSPATSASTETGWPSRRAAQASAAARESDRAALTGCRTALISFVRDGDAERGDQAALRCEHPHLVRAHAEQAVQGIAARGVKLVLGVQHVEQRALADAELGAVGLDDLNADVGMGLELRQALAARREPFPGLAQVALDVVARTLQVGARLVDARLRFAHARGIAAAAEQVRAPAQHDETVLVRPGHAVEVAVARAADLEVDARGVARARRVAFRLRCGELAFGGEYRRVRGERVLYRRLDVARQSRAGIGLAHRAGSVPDEMAVAAF